MKKVKILSLLFLSVTSFIACKKNGTSQEAGIAVTKTSLVKKGEPVVFTLARAAGDSVHWTVNPSANTQINASGNQASILFGAMGSYVVTGVSGNLTASTTVSVSDSVYTDSTGGASLPTTLSFSAGELIKITASRIDSGTASGLILSALTTNSYVCLSNSLLSTFSAAANSYNIDFTGVSVPAGCTTATASAGGFSFLYPVSAGTTTLTILFNGATYSGTIVKTGNSYVINWPYTTGVVISPTSL